MKKQHWIILAVVGVTAYYVFIYHPSLPDAITPKRIGKFVATFDGTTLFLKSAVTNQADTVSIFNKYAAVKRITDSTGTTFKRDNL